LTYIVEVQWINVDLRQIQVKRKLEGGVEIIRGPLPALLTVELELAQPRRAPLPLLVQSLRSEIKVWKGDDLRADPKKLGLKGSPTWVKKIFSPPVREGGPKFSAEEDLHGAVDKSLATLLADKTFAAKLFSRWEI